LRKYEKPEASLGYAQRQNNNRKTLLSL
jgi:hypothetical protein